MLLRLPRSEKQILSCSGASPKKHTLIITAPCLGEIRIIQSSFNQGMPIRQWHWQDMKTSYSIWWKNLYTDPKNYTCIGYRLKEITVKRCSALWNIIAKISLQPDRPPKKDEVNDSTMDAPTNSKESSKHYPSQQKAIIYTGEKWWWSSGLLVETPTFE